MANTVRIEIELSSMLMDEVRGLVGTSPEALTVFVESAVQRELLGERNQAADLPPDEAERVAGQAVHEVRQERSARHA